MVRPEKGDQAPMACPVASPQPSPSFNEEEKQDEVSRVENPLIGDGGVTCQLPHSFSTMSISSWMHALHRGGGRRKVLLVIAHVYQPSKKSRVGAIEVRRTHCPVGAVDATIVA